MRSPIARLGAGMFLGLALAGPVVAQYPTEPPPAGPLTPAPFPPFLETTLPNGLRLLVVESRKQPIVSISLSFPAGNVRDVAGREGLAAMAAGLLTKGAGNRTADQIAEAIEGVGGSLNASAGTDFLSVNATVLAPSLTLAFDLLADVVLRPTFPEQEVELLRTQTLSGLQVELTQPDAIAARAIRSALYGPHPYGRSPTPTSVRAITREEIVAFHGQQLRPGGALLVLAGDIGLEEARRQAMRVFQGWTGGPPPAPAEPAVPTRASTELVLVHRPGSVQSNILVGNLTAPATDPRRYAATVANKVLGGGVDSRLFLILREEKSWTYGAYSSFTQRKGVGSFAASAEVRTEVTDSALTELLTQLRRIREEPVPAAEFEAAKGALVGSYPLSIETASQVANAVANARLYGLPTDFVQTYRVRLGAVTPSEAQAAARELIRPDAAVIVVVGDGQQIHDRISHLAPTRIVDPEGKPLTPDDLAPKVAALPVDLTRLVARQDSFALMVQGNQLGAFRDSLEPTAEGFRYTESTRIAGFVEQDTDVRTDRAFSALTVHQRGRVQGQETRIDVTIADGRAVGSASTPGPTGEIRTVEIDTVVAAGAIEENLVQAVLPALPWSPEARFSFQVFATGSGETRPSTLAVTGTESVTTPAGTEACYVVQFTGGQAIVNFYVSVAEPHRVMKIQFVGAPIEMLRVK